MVAEEVETDHVSDHALRFSSDVSMERTGFRFTETVRLCTRKLA